MSDIRTKRALETSLKKLLLEKPLNKITIQDIADDCGVNRMTFYYHFKDIYDLVEWCCREDAEQALAGNRDYETWQQGLLGILNIIREDKPFIVNIYRSVGMERIEAFIAPQVHRLIREVAETYEQRSMNTLTEEEEDFIIDFYQYAFAGVIMKWIRNDMEEPPELLVARIAALATGNIEAAIGRFAQMHGEEGTP